MTKRKRHDNAQTTRQRANDTTTRKRQPAPTKTTHDHRGPRLDARTQLTRHHQRQPPTIVRRPGHERTRDTMDSKERRQRRTKTDDDDEATPSPTTTNGDDEATPMPTNCFPGLAAHPVRSPTLSARLSLSPLLLLITPLLITIPFPFLTYHHSLSLPYLSPLPPPPLLLTTPSPLLCF